MGKKLIYRARFNDKQQEPREKEIYRGDFTSDIVLKAKSFGNTVVQFISNYEKLSEAKSFIEEAISFSQLFCVNTDIYGESNGYVVTFYFDYNDFYKDEVMFLGPLLEKCDSCLILPAADREAEDENFPPCTLRLSFDTHRMLIFGQE